MNGSTRACISILGAFGFLAIVAGIVGVVFTMFQSNGSTAQSVFESVQSLGAVLSGTLLVGASEALRLLSEIRDRLPEPPSAKVQVGVRKAA